MKRYPVKPRSERFRPPSRLRTLPVGSRVLVRRDDGTTVETTTRSEPWKLSGHTWVVLLAGLSGAWALERIEILEVATP